jgi:ribonuclease Z
MKTSNEAKSTGLTRREMLKLSGLAVGGLALGGTMIGPTVGSASAQDTCQDGDCTCPEGPTCGWSDTDKSQRYSYFDSLLQSNPFYPFRDPPGVFPPAGPLNTTIREQGEDEMRITFMGSSIPPNQRRKQQMMSVFVEVGWDPDKQTPLDQFVFDCGSGVCTNYSSMNVSFGRMNKVFLNHLHGDHMSDLTHIYCFGPSADRLYPLYVWGPGPSGVKVPPHSGWVPRNYKDGTRAFCEHLREACRWHSESFSFIQTGYTPEEGWLTPKELQEAWGLPNLPIPVSDDPPNDGYAMIPFELTLDNYAAGNNIAYDNKTTGVKITYFPVIHTRKGSIGYKLEWTPPGIPGAKTLCMIYTSDTKPEKLSIENAVNGGKGVDVFIHEMIVPAQVWSMKNGNLTELPPFDSYGVQYGTMVQNSSHTPQGAFGYLLSQIVPRPRLTVATHFPVADDTVECAMKSVMEHCKVYQGNNPGPEDAARITWSFDCMVISVSKDQIVEQAGVISAFNYAATSQQVHGTRNPAKYGYADGSGNPYAQIDQKTAIEPCDCDTGACNYRADGY